MKSNKAYWIVFITLMVLVSVKSINYIDDGNDVLIIKPSFEWTWHGMINGLFTFIGIEFTATWVAKKWSKHASN